MWIHEGMATYSEALCLEKLYGDSAYDAKIDRDSWYISNQIPILKECGVLYNSWANYRDQDIYNKGSLLMHSLRFQVNNDSLFLSTLKTIQRDLKYQNISTEDIVQKFNTLLGSDYSMLFDWYLKKAEPPVLEVFIDEEKDKLHYRWKEEIPFFKNGTISIKTSEGMLTINPTLEYQTTDFVLNRDVRFLRSPSIYYQPKRQKKLE